MATTQINEAKRQEMAALIAEVLGPKGWSVADLAVYMSCSTSNISSWKNGKNMGTNSQRSMLANIPPRAEADEAVARALASAIKHCQHKIERTQNLIKSDKVYSTPNYRFDFDLACYTPTKRIDTSKEPIPAGEEHLWNSIFPNLPDYPVKRKVLVGYELEEYRIQLQQEHVERASQRVATNLRALGNLQNDLAKLQKRVAA